MLNFLTSELKSTAEPHNTCGFADGVVQVCIGCDSSCQGRCDALCDGYVGGDIGGCVYLCKNECGQECTGNCTTVLHSLLK